MQDVTQGVERTRVWPAPRGKAKTAGDIARQDKFAQAQQATKYFAPELYSAAITATEGTPLLPRDIMTMQLFGRLLAFVFEDGRILWPMPARQDVSTALDIIAADPGQTLVRGPWGWEAQDPAPTPPPAIISARAVLSANQLLNTGVYELIDFDTLLFGDASLFDVAHASWVAPAGYNRASFSLFTGVTGTDLTGYFSAWIQPQGSAAAWDILAGSGVHTDFFGFLSVETGPIEVSPGDEFVAYARASGGKYLPAPGQSAAQFGARFWNE